MLTLVLTAYLTRALGPGAFGILAFGAAILSYFLLATRLGFDVVGVREIARAPGRVVELARSITSVQLFLSVLAYMLFALLVGILPKSGLVKLVLMIQGLALFAQAFAMDWVYQGVERMGVLAFRIVAIAAVHLLAALMLVHQPEDVPIAAAAQVGALILLNGWLFYTFARDFGRPNLRIDFASWRALLPASIPIAASAFMVGVFYNVDQVMLGLLRSDTEVGLFAASVRALAAALIPAAIISKAFFPALAGVNGDPEAMRSRATAFASAMLPVGIPLATLAAMLAGPLIVLFAGEEYAPASTTVCLLMANAGLVYVNMTFGQAIIAWNREKAYMLIVGAGALLDIGLNLFMIPRFGIVGAASTTLASQCVLLVGLGIVHYKIVQLVFASILARTLAASILGVVVPILIARQIDLPLAATVLFAACAYILFALSMRLVTVSKMRSLIGRGR